jgi:outer membrane cobalamin receptor
MRRNVLCLLASVLCFPLWAQQTPELNEVVVTATRIDSPLLESPSAISVVTSNDIPPGTSDLSVVLGGLAGVAINDYGPVGATKNVSLRGSTSDQVLVLVDGMRLNSRRISSVDLSVIPIEDIDRVEVLRGGASTIYGSGAIGGVINIITKKLQTPQVSISVANGSFLPHDANEVASSMALTPVSTNYLDLVDSQTVELSMAGAVNGVGLNGGGSFTRAANAFTWNDSAVIDAWRRRINADVLSGSAFTGLTAGALGGQLNAKALLVTSDIGAPGQISSPWVSTTARQKDTTATATLSWKSERFISDALTLDLKTLYRYDQLSYTDPAISVDSLHRTHTVAVDVTQKLTISDRASPVYGGSAYFDYADSTNFSGIKDRLNLAAFLSVPLSPLETLTVTPAVRYDYFTDTAGSFSYSLSAVLLLSELSSLRASVGSSYRAPTFNDLYWSDPYTVTNPDLKPETSYDAEIGWSLQYPFLTLDASGFTRLVFNNIVWWTDPNTYVTYVRNLTETFFPGAEIHAKVMLPGALSLEASYTFLYSFLLDDGTTAHTLADNLRVLNTPVHTVSAGLRFAGKPVAAGVEAQYVSDKYTDNSNSVASMIHGHFVLNADLKYAATEQVAFSLSAKNVLNTLYYTQLGYPMPPFSIETGVQVHL